MTPQQTREFYSYSNTEEEQTKRPSGKVAKETKGKRRENSNSDVNSNSAKCDLN